MIRAHRVSFVREAALAAVLLASVYGLRTAVPLHPLLFSVSSLDLRTPTLLFGLPVDLTGAARAAAFAAYLFVLGLVGTAVARGVRRLSPDRHRSGWRLGAAGALGVTGLLWVANAAVFYGTTHTDHRPIIVTGLSGLVLLGWPVGSPGRSPTDKTGVDVRSDRCLGCDRRFAFGQTLLSRR